MAYPEPSLSDHLAPWNEGDDGECECTSCKRKKKEQFDEEYGDYLYEVEKDRRRGL